VNAHAAFWTACGKHAVPSDSDKCARQDRVVIEATRLRRLLIIARPELGNARDLALGATEWVEGAAEKHWNGNGQGARLLRRIVAALGEKASQCQIQSS
jgi:hypothetical protein